jgi:L-cysteine:1D-myo-inositol 2-amino-2-deoxy-alpha-D-glucopyranoside ligase
MPPWTPDRLAAVQPWPTPSRPALPGHGLPLRLFDTAAGQVLPVTTGDTARMYVCGITPYDATHIGHANTYVAFDLVHRSWLDTGKTVDYIQNVTDVDDPLLERAAATGEDWVALAERETRRFHDDMTALRVIPPKAYPGAVEAIPAVVALIERLRDQGAAYQVDDDWYFAVGSDIRFGSVAGLDRTEMLEVFGERGGDPDRPGKKDALDCLLWLAARPGEPSWDSPLGPGRPGWHIECSAIALELLGMGFDLQGGGKDLAFPHHEMGASEAQVVTGEWPYARTYVHSGMVGLDGEKMSKSKGNLVFVSKLRESGVDPMAIRLALIAHHYRSDWEWTDQSLTDAQARLARWREGVSAPTGPSGETTLSELRRLLADDLQTPLALDAIDRWCEEQRLRGGVDLGGPGLVSRSVDALLGIAT